jgi:sulfatase maturation enzyme AslB (radical SAM superfamily)
MTLSISTVNHNALKTSETFLKDVFPAYDPQNPPQSDAQRMALCETDLNRYKRVFQRETFPAIEAPKNRDVRAALLKAYAQKLSPQVANPVMLTHILTTRCNYSCPFCCFADSLNNKTQELSLEDITKTYASIGDSLNVIVYSGGETTLNKNLADIIETAYRLTPVKSVYIISNAWKPDVLFDITHRIKQTCPDLHLTWSLSIEGFKRLNNANRFTKAENHDAWQNTIDTMWGLKAMREHFGYTQLDAQLCTVCSPDSAPELHAWYDFIKTVLKPDKWNLNLMRKSVQMEGSELASFEARRRSGTLEPFEQTYLDVTERVRQDVISGEFRFLYHTDSPADGAMKSAVDLMSQEENRRTVTGEPLSFGCRAGSYGAYISSDGLVSACEEFAHNPTEAKAFGRLQDVDFNFRALWASPKADEYRACVGKSSECFGCTLESQRNYPSILLSLKQLWTAHQLAKTIS